MLIIVLILLIFNSFNFHFVPDQLINVRYHSRILNVHQNKGRRNKAENECNVCTFKTFCASILTYLKRCKRRSLTRGWCKTYSHARTLQTCAYVPISKCRRLVASVLEPTTRDRPKAPLGGRAIGLCETGRLLPPFAPDSSNSGRGIDLLLHTECLKVTQCRPQLRQRQFLCPNYNNYTEYQLTSSKSPRTTWTSLANVFR